MPRRLRADAALINANGALWAVGSGLVSTTLVIYLALELGAPGSAIGMILAAPRLGGVLRVFAPVLLAWFRHRKAICLALFAASGVTLFAMPFLASPRFWASGEGPAAEGAAGAPLGVSVLVVCWFLYQLFERCGAVLLWSWLGDLMPFRLRGRLIGKRETWVVIGQIAGMTASFALVQVWSTIAPDAPRWEPLGWSALVGAGLLLVSIGPLAAMSACHHGRGAQVEFPWREMRESLADRRYRKLLLFSCCFSIANGITASAQALYPQRVLGISYPAMLGLRATMRTGQASLASRAGRWLDRHGAKRMMFASQLVVATGPLFFLIATPDRKWWIAGAFIAWIAYVGLNVGLDHLKLGLAPPDRSAPALAVYYGLSDLANGVMSVLGGVLYDRLSAGGADVLRLYAVLFAVGWIARTAVAWLLLRLEEPAESTGSA